MSPGFSLRLCPPEQIGAHFAAQSPERSFFFPLFLSAEKEKEVISGDAVTKSLSANQTPTVNRAVSPAVGKNQLYDLSKNESPVYLCTSRLLSTMSFITRSEPTIITMSFARVTAV